MTEDLKKSCRIIISEFPTKPSEKFDFDSHNVISMLDSEKYKKDLLTALWEMVPIEEKQLIRHKLHREIGRWMKNEQEMLNIEYIGKQVSPNYKEDDTLNAIWKKL